MTMRKLEELIVPERLHSGDTVALISISGGRAGDRDMLPRYETGKRRLQEIFHVNVVETPHALKGSDFLYHHPEKRAEDLLWALESKDIRGIICNMGGDDSYRVLPFVPPEVIASNPKVFMGYSDIASWMAMFAYAGVRAYYGPNLLTPIAQPASMDTYTLSAIRRVLFQNDVIGEVVPTKSYTRIEWNDQIDPDSIHWEENTGYRVLQGKRKAKGRLFGGTGGPLRQIMGMKFFPKPEFFDNCILALETGLPYGSVVAQLHEYRVFAAAGILNRIAGLLTPKLNNEERTMLQKLMRDEVHRDELPILENVDFVHRTPMTVLSMGALCEIDCDNAKLAILEAGVR